jgi:type IV pilus assembly protein PilB
MAKNERKESSIRRFGEILLEQKLITEEQFQEAVHFQKTRGGQISEILIKKGMVKEDDVAFALSQVSGIPFISSRIESIKPVEDQGLERLISRQFALRNTVIPLSKDGNILTCAMFDPFDFILIDELRKITGCEVNPVIATKSDILKAIEEFYSGIHVAKKDVRKPYEISKFAEEGKSLSLEGISTRSEEAPVIKLVDLMLWQAIDRRASDIHIEPFNDRLCLRYRIDGKLYEIASPPFHLHLPIVSRIKILSKLDIAERRLPQDGAFMVKLDDRNIDIRVSIIPTIYGEKVVLRILDRTGIILDLDQMGFEPFDLERLRKVIHSPYGLVLITGPTGSGKSTTLYAILQEIKSTTVNITTVEDPVEYRLEGINQVQVKPEIGLTFAHALRSFLRQDPDIILVGEVRDLETAEICIRSALTGHLVFSTLHTNDAPSAITRLIDIGVETYLLAPSILMVIGQRLVRRLCPECKEPYKPSVKELEDVRLTTDLIYRPKGCASCSNTGYKGRTLIAEVMPVSDEIRELIVRGTSYKEMRAIARRAGMSTFYESGLKKVEQGITSMEEVLSVTLGV